MSLVDLGKRLLEAAKRGDTEEVRQLMTNGAPFTTDWLGISPLHMAAQHGHLNTADVLIRAGISRDARTKVDRTPLHVAAQEGHVDIVNLLLKNGADVEAKDMLQMTPLHWAVEKSHLPVIELLLKHNADVFSLSKFDKSPADIALDNGRVDIVQMLKSIKTEIKEKNPGISSAAGTTTIVVTTPDNVTVPTISKMNTSAPIFITTNLATSAHPGTLKITSDDDSSDQSSTSVLATLAALAEATASTPQSTSVSAQEALSWLESHGIAMVPADNSAVVTAAIEGGQTLSLTEAGKLALNWAKQQSNGNTEPTVETAIDGVVGNSGSEQKVITIVTDQSQLSTLTANPRAAPILTAMLADLSQGVTDKTTNGEPPNKKVCLSNSTPSSDTDDPKDKQEDFDREQLKRELEEAHRQAEDYKQQLLKTQYEAEEYKKQLDKISRKAAKAENPR